VTTTIAGYGKLSRSKRDGGGVGSIIDLKTLGDEMTRLAEPTGRIGLDYEE
jgi:hypothetical protein